MSTRNEVTRLNLSALVSLHTFSGTHVTVSGLCSLSPLQRDWLNCTYTIIEWACDSAAALSERRGDWNDVHFYTDEQAGDKHTHTHRHRQTDRQTHSEHTHTHTHTLCALLSRVVGGLPAKSTS